MTETIFARGHENIQATHKSTLEITKEAEVSKRGNCIIAVCADKALSDLSPKFKDALRNRDARITLLIEAEEIKETVHALGSPMLTLSHLSDIVVRKSNHICSRTLAIQADKAAYDLSRELAKKLSNPRQKLSITLTARV